MTGTLQQVQLKKVQSKDKIITRCSFKLESSILYLFIAINPPSIVLSQYLMPSSAMGVYYLISIFLAFALWWLLHLGAAVAPRPATQDMWESRSSVNHRPTSMSVA